MKTNILYFIFGMMLLIFSCKNPCKNVDCGHGLCNKDDGNCYCADGWLKDTNGKCNKQDLCYQKDCGNGVCNDANGSCNCNPGWQQDASGKCTIYNPCFGLDCGTYGECNVSTGDCDCLPGYEVNAQGKCEIESRQKFIGTYNVTDICPSGTYNYQSTILQSSQGIDKVIFQNYGGWGNGSGQLEVYASISGNIISIPQQGASLGSDTFIISPASGTLTGNTFAITYTITVNGVAETCQATLTKQ